jgi:hypothetical protein
LEDASDGTGLEAFELAKLLDCCCKVSQSGKNPINKTCVCFGGIINSSIKSISLKASSKGFTQLLAI